MAKLPVKTLTVLGEQDFIAREYVQELAPFSKEIILPEVGHSPFIECPGQLFPALADFLRGNQWTN